MNIKTNEILLWNKIKFGEGESTNSGTAPAPQEPTEKDGMKALTFQGMKNLMSNPQLAQKAGVMNDETLPQENSEAKSYAAPFATNMVTFGSRVGVAKSLLLSGAAAATMASCTIRQETDISGLVKVMNQAFAMLATNQAATQDEIAALRGDLNLILSAIQTGNANASEFYKALTLAMAKMETNQQTIIANLQLQGLSLDEANAYLKQLIADVDADNKDAMAAYFELMALLKNIDTNVGNIYNEIVKLNAQIEEMRKENKTYAENIIKNQGDTNQNIINLSNGVTGIGATLCEISAKESQMIYAIRKMNFDNNQRLDFIAQKIGISTAYLASIIEKHGYTLEQAMNMNASQIIEILQQDVATNNNIYNTLIQLLQSYESGKLDAEAFAQAVLAELGKINGSLEDIKLSLEEIKAELREILKTVKSESAQIKNLIAGLLAQGNITNAQLTQINQRLANQSGSLTQIANLIQQFMQMYQENPNSVTKEDLAELISWLNIQQELRTDEILNVAQQGLANQQTIISLMNKLVQYASKYPDYSSQLTALYNKLVDIQNDNSKSEEQRAADLAKVQAELDAILNKLGDIEQSIDEIKAELRNILRTVKSETAQIKSMIAGLLAQGNITNAQLAQINQRLEGQKGNLARIENLIAQFMQMYQENPNSVTKEDLAELISWLNIQQELRTDEILNVAKQGLANQQTIISLMGKLVQYASQFPDYSSQLTALYNKLVDIQNDNSKSEAQRAKDLAKVQAELDAILEKLGDIEEQIAALFKEVGAQTTLISKLANRLFAKLDDLKALLQKGNATLSSILTQQTVTNNYLKEFNTQLNTFKQLIANIEAKMGHSLTKQELEELWQKHDAANFANYKAFLNTLHAEDLAEAEKILAGIQKENEHLQEIIELIKKLPADLQAIAIQLLAGWDPCCCDCNNHIHEGILDLIKENNGSTSSSRAFHIAKAKGGTRI